MPAIISPITSGSFKRLKIKEKIFAETISKLIARIVVIGLKVDKLCYLNKKTYMNI